MAKNFIESFFTNFSKKCLTLGENMCIMCLSPPIRRNETKKAQSVRISKRKSRTAKKSSKKCLTKFQNSDIMWSHKQGMPHPTTKSDENANHQ
jgi:hypothetical protein